MNQAIEALRQEKEELLKEVEELEAR